MKAADFFPFRHEVREGTLKAVSNLPPEHLEWKPPGGTHSIIGWLRHIAQSEDWWIQACVLGKHDFAQKRKADLPDLPSVLRYLGETRSITERLLEEWPAEMLKETRPVPPAHRGPNRGPVVSLHWLMGHLYNHERHHRAQISLYVRLMGLEPPAY